MKINFNKYVIKNLKKNLKIQKISQYINNIY